jgi:hypothetical protein
MGFGMKQHHVQWAPYHGMERPQVAVGRGRQIGVSAGLAEEGIHCAGLLEDSGVTDECGQTVIYGVWVWRKRASIVQAYWRTVELLMSADRRLYMECGFGGRGHPLCRLIGGQWSY